MNGIADDAKAFLRRHPALGGPARKITQLAWKATNQRRHRREAALFGHLADTLVEDPCLSVAEFGGEFYLDPRSALFRRVIVTGAYEPELTKVCRAHVDPERDVLDVGANVGFHSVLFGSLLRGGRVLALEPTARAAARLVRNLERNGVADKVEVFQGAAADAEGTMNIKTVPGREEFSTLGEMAHPAMDGQQWVNEAVRVTTLDRLVAERDLAPGFIKVDVEGAEHLVFGGASELLSVHRPVIVTELSDPLLRANGSSARAVIEVIRGHDYTLIDPLRPGAGAGAEAYGDVLCLPN